MSLEPITRAEQIMTGENLEPITREEMFLAKAAGMDVDTPEPITRREMFLSQIGGGGGDDDWYIDAATYLFYDNARLNNLELFMSKLKDVTNMSSMFARCSSLTSLDVSNFDTSKVTNMSSMFTNCSALTSLDVSNFDTSNVTNMSSMFTSCSALTSLDVSNFDTSKVTNMGNMFNNCTALVEIIGFSATNKAGLFPGFPAGASSSYRMALKRLTFRTDLGDGVYSIRSAIKIPYCSFERDGMVEMFNTLPDVSSLGLSASYTTITITGNPCVTDGTLTAEDEAIATSKGWTLVK